MKLDLKKFEGSLPYASEIFGVYSAMIGWKSKRIEERLFSPPKYLDSLKPLLSKYSLFGKIDDQNYENCQIKAEFEDKPSKPFPNSSSIIISILTTIVLDSNPPRPSTTMEISEAIFNYLNKITDQTVVGLRNAITTKIRDNFTTNCKELNYPHESPYEGQRNLILKNYNQKLTLELRMLELLKDLSKADRKNDIINIISEEFKLRETSNKISPNNINEVLGITTTTYFDPQNDLKDITLSPMGIVHLFRQYFFEFDTFLGTPVDHVWLSPGASVTLIEEKTSKKLIEKSIEELYESTIETEEYQKVSDEFSEAIKKENNQDISIGASVDVYQEWGSGNMNASTNLEFDTTRNIAKEEAHKRMREQSHKISSKIRRSYKTNFKSVEEYVETSFKKYVLANTTDKLINYELRRKMRQVGVQVQDIGSYLCWQTFVDNPGKELGLANLIHIASPADLDSIPRESLAELPKKKTIEHPVSIPFVPVFREGRYKEFDNLKTDKTYENGIEIDKNQDNYVAEGLIKTEHEIALMPPEENYILKSVDLASTNGNVCSLQILGDFISEEFKSGVFKVNLLNVNYGGKLQLDITFRGVWEPNDLAIKKITDANTASEDAYGLKVDRAIQEAYLEKVKERVNFASNINERNFRELREEERIIVYRKLIKSLMDSVYGDDYKLNEEEKEHHIISEMINSIFDVNKMLYYVAPDWWKPKDKINYKQSSFRGANLKESLVDWGDPDRDENYLITEESKPAKLGSSLGWLMQLDGDNMRNAFLNAPWVKAVIPIRPGKEREALNWLKHIEGEEGLNAKYESGGDVPEEYRDKTIMDILEYLADRVKEKHEKGKTVTKHPPIDDDNTVNATPIDKVYEYGFYPLQGGFKAQTTEDFEIFDQWIEVLPTDQIVPVEVEYDPKTGLQK